MSTTHKIETRRKLIYLFWGLLFTKCFSLEFLVRHYQTPVNSLAYVWCLSIAMAAVATVVYGRVEGSFKKAGFEVSFAVFASSASAALLVLWSLLDRGSDSQHMLAVAALMVGLSRWFASSRESKPLRLPLSLGWCLVAALLMLSPPPLDYLIFAIAIPALFIAPRCFNLLLNRQK